MSLVPTYNHMYMYWPLLSCTTKYKPQVHDIVSTGRLMIVLDSSQALMGASGGSAMGLVIARMERAEQDLGGTQTET
jgi:hypothetical protein